MGLKLLNFGEFGCGKTGFAATMAEIGNIGVVDTEQRWQYYTDPHPTTPPRKASPAAIAAGAPPLIYANPRILRHDIPWLPRTSNVIWLVQTMDPAESWECRKIWANDLSIVGQVADSASVLWDMLQDTRETVSAKGNELGGLSWAPVKRVDRRMMYTMIEASHQHFIANAHKQELMNNEMKVTGTRPWAEKRSPHWYDLLLQFAFGSEDKAPRVRVDREKILGGVNGALKMGAVLVGPTFKQILALAGGDRNVISTPKTILSIDAASQRLVNTVAATPPIPGVDTPGKGGPQ